MTPEQLLKLRYRAKVNYPYSPYITGEIIPILGERAGVSFCTLLDYTVCADLYPDVFEKVKWWEERKPEDMPQYLKVGEGCIWGGSKEGVFKVWKHFTYILEGCNSTKVSFTSDVRYVVIEVQTSYFQLYCTKYDYFKPATEEEYLEFTKNQTK